ncbi:MULTISPECIES: helix-turn-helix domain-containing protein [unclassified Streptomyces]|uniref:helix-turn-helix domain-containing protein n=1 Tax=unclassified Streptomyces TaxID=2593676 RepID=UPI00371D2285
MLQELGLDATDERVYRAMLEHPRDGVAALVARLALPESTLRACLDRLSALTLVLPATYQEVGFRAVSPKIAMEVLLSRQQAELAAHQHRVDASRAAAARLVAEYSAPRERAEDAGLELLLGAAAIRDRLSDLAESVQHEIMTFAPGGAHTEEDLRASREPNTAMLRRGVAMRTIYLDSVRNHQPTLRHVDWLHQHGGNVRTAPALPIRMIIVDRRLAVLPVDPAEATAGAVIQEGPGTVAALCALFENVWVGASPFGTAATRDAHGLSSQHAETLRLLSQGLTDEAIAKRLGVSPRTARRIAAELLSSLGARSRFEAGVHAVQRGWLPTTP